VQRSAVTPSRAHGRAFARPHRSATLEIGKVANLCDLDQDLLSIDPNEIPSSGVLMTVPGGQIVHDGTETSD